jgi:general secretion pathway protein G
MSFQGVQRFLGKKKPYDGEEERSMRAERIRRSVARGVTLIEVMIVVVILGLIAGGVAVAVFPKLKKAQVDTTTTSARALRSVAETWRSEHASDQCPTPQVLMNDHAIDSASKITDAWDDPFTIICQEDETIVTSPGPDKKENTPDDIRVPALPASQK